jgi:hypothetical protein
MIARLSKNHAVFQLKSMGTNDLHHEGIAASDVEISRIARDPISFEWS